MPLKITQSFNIEILLKDISPKNTYIEHSERGQF
ncbi:hypothetical protein AT01_1685 [Yersinia aldovae 670-83]|nr:hypothetical protein AT01_1685 [Yersinia aldovae 670-83]